MIAPMFSAATLIGQINKTGSIDGNWFMGIIMLILGFLLVTQIREIKSELKQNTEVTGQMKIDIAIIKHKLGIE